MTIQSLTTCPVLAVFAHTEERNRHFVYLTTLFAKKGCKLAHRERFESTDMGSVSELLNTRGWHQIPNTVGKLIFARPTEHGQLLPVEIYERAGHIWWAMVGAAFIEIDLPTDLGIEYQMEYDSCSGLYRAPGEPEHVMRALHDAGFTKPSMGSVVRQIEIGQHLVTVQANDFDYALYEGEMVVPPATLFYMGCDWPAAIDLTA